MGMVGCLGDIVFTVSDRTIKTIDNVTWSGSARYATHQRHGTHALTEFTGLDPDKMSFDIVLSAYLGVDPITEVVKLWNYERGGIAVPLVRARPQDENEDLRRAWQRHQRHRDRQSARVSEEVKLP